MTRYIFAVVMLIGISLRSTAQNDVWDLNKCIEFAQQNSIVVQQYANQVDNTGVELNTAQNSRLPNLSASIGSTMYFGRSQSRTGIYTNNNQLSGNLGVTTNMPVFQGFKIKNNIEAGKLNLSAAVKDLERAKESVALNITSLYLQVLFNKELVKVAVRQLELSTQLVERSKLLVENGKNPESLLFESQSLMANDELALTQSRNNLAIALLDLSQALNRESASGFDVVEPDFGALPAGGAQNITGGITNIYDYAVATKPQIKAEQLRLESSEKSLNIAKSNFYPTISFGAGYGSSLYKSYANGILNDDFMSQLRNNGNEYFGLSMSIPIFNRNATRNQVRAARLRMDYQQLALLEAKQKLRKEVEQAHYSADAAYSKYIAANKALESALVAFNYEQQKSQLGRSTVFDYNDARMRMEKAESNLIQAKYEFIFQTKIIDFYAGKPLGF